MLWQQGVLNWKWHGTQRAIDDAIAASGKRRHFLLCSRRLGKSHYLLCKAFECCLQQPNRRVLYLAPTGKDAQEIATDLALQVLEDCPAHLKPTLRVQAKELVFPNGSLIRFKGVNGEHAESIRGGAADLAILDECGIMDNLHYVLQSVVGPMTATTRGRIYLATTPPKSPGHESAEVYEAMAKQGATSLFTLRDAPHIPFEEKVRLLLECGEAEGAVEGILQGTWAPVTTAALREYFCRFVTDSSLAVVPEFDEAAQAEVVREWPCPEYFDAYVSLDPGYVDNTGCLFGYWDFKAATLVIEDEVLLRRPGTDAIADAIKAKEAALWPGRTPYVRITDIDKRLVADFANKHALPFHLANKKDSSASINLLRTLVGGRQLAIHPRCVHLVRQLRNATFSRNGKDLARGGEVDGHYDLVAALKYLARGVQQTRNPYPTLYNGWRPGMALPRASPKPSLGLLDNTPLGRKLARAKG